MTTHGDTGIHCVRSHPPSSSTSIMKRRTPASRIDESDPESYRRYKRWQASRAYHERCVLVSILLRTFCNRCLLTGTARPATQRSEKGWPPCVPSKNSIRPSFERHDSSPRGSRLGSIEKSALPSPFIVALIDSIQKPQHPCSQSGCCTLKCAMGPPARKRCRHPTLHAAA